MFFFSDVLAELNNIMMQLNNNFEMQSRGPSQGSAVPSSGRLTPEERLVEVTDQIRSASNNTLPTQRLPLPAAPPPALHVRSLDRPRRRSPSNGAPIVVQPQQHAEPQQHPPLGPPPPPPQTRQRHPAGQNSPV